MPLEKDHQEAFIWNNGRISALDQCDFNRAPGEVLDIIDNNGAGKSTLIKATSHTVTLDKGIIVEFESKIVNFRFPIESKAAGTETVY
ncbi:MAG: ATP-binding cassette domain-containing protein [Aestuariivita sp.]|nr:ATP-binding cassette domain-containing protein [Aestuariivita sp.]